MKKILCVSFTGLFFSNVFSANNTVDVFQTVTEKKDILNTIVIFEPDVIILDEIWFLTNKSSNAVLNTAELRSIIESTKAKFVIVQTHFFKLDTDIDKETFYNQFDNLLHTVPFGNLDIKTIQSFSQ